MNEILLNTLKNRFVALQAEAPTLYDFLNQYRDWFNQTVGNYEFFLEDNWFEDKTTIEYCIRSLETLNHIVFAEDEYLNSRDTQTWHLGEYIKTSWTVDEPWEEIETFLRCNPLPKPRAVSQA